MTFREKPAPRAAQKALERTSGSVGVSVTAITLRHLIAMGLLAALAVANSLVLLRAIRLVETSMAVVNEAGAQRIRAPRIALATARLALHQDASARGRLRHELAQQIQEMREKHSLLISLGPDGRVVTELPPKLRALYFSEPVHLDQQVREYLSDATAVLNLPSEEIRVGNEQFESVTDPAVRARLLDALDAAVVRYEEEAISLVRDLRKVDLGLLAANLIVLVITGHFIFRPAVQRIRTQVAALTRQTREMEDKNIEIEKRNAELLVSNQELDEFAYIVSHDLKEPLRGIHNYSSFLLEDYSDRLDEEGRNKLETLGRLTKRMEELIEAVLHYSRVGRLELERRPVDLNRVLAEVLESLQVSLDERGVEVRIPWPLPEIRCDPARVSEIFRNLISNASKYNDKPEKWVEIGYLEPHSQVGSVRVARWPVFFVRDNGIGIRDNHLKSIYRIFKRLHGRDRFGGGTGIGLTIVKKLVERHGGKIWAESIYGQGTTFYFVLPEGRHAEQIASRRPGDSDC